MKKYGYSYNKLMKIVRKRGSGCFYCTQEKKSTKTVTRRKAKEEIKKTVLSSNELRRNSTKVKIKV